MKEDEMGGSSSVHAYKMFIVKPEWRRLLGRPKNTWEVNIEMDHMEIG
jgi:hypothetical protein